MRFFESVARLPGSLPAPPGRTDEAQPGIPTTVSILRVRGGPLDPGLDWARPRNLTGAAVLEEAGGASLERYRSRSIRGGLGRSHRSAPPNIQLHPPGPTPAPWAPREFRISAPIPSPPEIRRHAGCFRDPVSPRCRPGSFAAGARPARRRPWMPLAPASPHQPGRCRRRPTTGAGGAGSRVVPREMGMLRGVDSLPWARVPDSDRPARTAM